MSLDFVSGLLLVAVVVAIAVYVVRELLPERRTASDQDRAARDSSVARYVGGDSKPINAHLIGTGGKVVAHSRDAARPMKVRLGVELWPARLPAADEGALPIGTPVKVMGIDGPVMVVEADSGADPSATNP